MYLFVQLFRLATGRTAADSSITNVSVTVRDPNFSIAHKMLFFASLNAVPIGRIVTGAPSHVYCLPNSACGYEKFTGSIENERSGREKVLIEHIELQKNVFCVFLNADRGGK